MVGAPRAARIDKLAHAISARRDHNTELPMRWRLSSGIGKSFATLREQFAPSRPGRRNFVHRRSGQPQRRRLHGQVDWFRVADHKPGTEGRPLRRARDSNRQAKPFHTQSDVVTNGAADSGHLRMCILDYGTVVSAEPRSGCDTLILIAFGPSQGDLLDGLAWGGQHLLRAWRRT